MPWSTVAKYLLIVAVLGGAVWWISDGRYSAGKLDGETDGYRRGFEAATKLHDAAMLALLAESRADAERALREARDATEAENRRQRADMADALAERDRNLSVVDAERQRLLARLRAVQRTGSQDRSPDRGGGLPATGSAVAVASTPARLLHAATLGDLADLARDADTDIEQFRICYRYARSMKAAPATPP